MTPRCRIDQKGWVVRRAAVVLTAVIAIVGAPVSAAVGGTTKAAGNGVRPAASACGQDYYKNVDGVCVHRPSTSPRGATARCRDGAYSYSRHASGTCSGHGGVRLWLRRP